VCAFLERGSLVSFAGRFGTIARVHLRPPSIDHGVISFLWAFGLGLYLWLGMLAIGVSGATAFVLSAVAACVIFLLVRVYGEEEPRRP
jgi:hypothetical protein